MDISEKCKQMGTPYSNYTVYILSIDNAKIAIMQNIDSAGQQNMATAVGVITCDNEHPIII